MTLACSVVTSLAVLAATLGTALATPNVESAATSAPAPAPVEDEDRSGDAATAPAGDGDEPAPAATPAPTEEPAPVVSPAPARAEDGLRDQCERTRRTIYARAMRATEPATRSKILLLMPDCTGDAETPGTPMVLTNSHDDEDDVESDKPKLSGLRLAGELVAGSIGVVGGAVGGGLIGGMATRSYGGMGVGGLLGALVGGTLGVYAVGSAGDQEGSFGATLGGATLGFVGGGIIAGVAMESKQSLAPSIAVGVVGTVAGAMIGFNVTRRWEPAHRRAQTALVPVVSTGETTSLGVAGSF